MHLLLCLSHSNDTHAYGSCISKIITRNDYTCAMCLRIKQRENAWNIFIQCTHQTKEKHAKNLRNAVLLWLSQCFGYFNLFLTWPGNVSSSRCQLKKDSIFFNHVGILPILSLDYRLKTSTSHIISF